jgi:hypothetical protein
MAGSDEEKKKIIDGRLKSKSTASVTKYISLKRKKAM